MTALQKREIKQTGSHFTPSELALFLARSLVKHLKDPLESEIRVLDPACGDGELLSAFVSAIPPHIARNVVLLAVDINKEAVEVAKTHLFHLPVKRVEIQHADFLEAHIFQAHRFDTAPPIFSDINIVIANPPYVRTQALGAAKSQSLSQFFNIKGRLDLYQAFLVAISQVLTPGGMLGIITSNKFLTTKTGASTRSFILNHFDIHHVIDLGDTKLFKAAVLPAIVIATRKTQSADVNKTHPAVRLTRIYESHAKKAADLTVPSASDSIYDILSSQQNGVYETDGRRFELASNEVASELLSSSPWVIATPNEQSWLDLINSASHGVIGDFFKVRVGIKTTADEVFIRDNWETLPPDLQPEANLLRHVLSQQDAQRWLAPAKTTRRVLYTHEIAHAKRQPIDLRHYPKASAYLETHRQRLESRDYIMKAKRQWYEIWVPQNPRSWTKPKIVFPDISPDPRFFYDVHGSIVDGNCYWLINDRDINPALFLLVLGVANSKLMTKYHDLAFNNKLYAGRRRYLTQYVAAYPLPHPDHPAAREIIRLVKVLIGSAHDGAEQEDLEHQLEAATAEAFGVPIVG